MKKHIFALLLSLLLVVSLPFSALADVASGSNAVLDDPNLEFRFCSKCNGNYEYCQDHLFTHEHVK